MKKLFLLFLTVGVFASCSKDESGSNPIDGNCKLTEWKSFYDEGDGFENGTIKKLHYDNQNRISKVETYYGNSLQFSTNYSYTSNKITVSSPVQIVVYTLNTNNLIESYTTDGSDKVNVTYNSSNQISTISKSYVSYSFEYTNGNITTANEKYKNSSENRPWKLTYDNSKNFSPAGTFGLSPFYELFGDTDYEASHILYEQGYFGVKIKNAVSTIVDGSNTKNYNYVFTDGKISSYGRQDEKFELKYSCN